MPEYRPNQVARIAAVLALVGALVVFIALVATSGGTSDDDNGSTNQQLEKTGPTKKGERAVERGVWIVRSGDTLGQISEETGIDTDELIQLNADLDPQALLEGQRIALR